MKKVKKIKITQVFLGELCKETAFYRAWVTPHGHLLQRKEDNLFLKFQGSFLFKFLIIKNIRSIGSMPDHACFVSNLMDNSTNNLVVLKTKDSITKKKYESLIKKNNSTSIKDLKDLNDAHHYPYPLCPVKTSFEELDNTILISEA